MAHLTLTGVSDDGLRLLLHSDQGGGHTLDITPELRAALRGTGSRPGTLEVTMDSALRPKDIQARIRSGEDPESVALAAKTSLDKIMPFVGPVLAERAHVADRAQRSSLRRQPGEAGSGRVLGGAVEAHLRSVNIDPTTVEWDAWRREDGRWALRGTYAAGARAGTAEFTFDAPGNYVLLDNEDARWLVGEVVATDAEPAASRDDLESARQRRLSSVPPDELPLGDDAIELVTSAPASGADTDTDTDTAVRAAGDVPFDVDEQMPLEAFFDTSPGSDDPQAREEAADAAAEEPDPAPARRPVQKKKGRASVPSWDEIMFGGSDQ